MPRAGLRTLLAILEVFRPALTRPGFENLKVLFAGWVQTTGVHAVTEALVVTGLAGRVHHEAFHRFFSRGTWSPDALGKQLFSLLLRHVPEGAPLRIVVDDTLAPKKGPHVFGIGSHLDAVRSTRRQKIFSFGHTWVVLAVLVQVPFAKRLFALPLLFRLYRTQRECEAKGHAHRKKTQLARELIDVFVGWCGERRVVLAMDGAYCNDTVMRGLPAQVSVFGAMRPDAVLTAAPKTPPAGTRGARPTRGEVLRKPEDLARDGRTPWRSCTAQLYGRKTKVHYKQCIAQWYRACGVRLLKVVVVRVDTGAIGIRVFFSTDKDIDVPTLLESYSGRWPIEVCFRDLKQLMGFADSSARTRHAVERTAPFAGLAYSTIVLWALCSPRAVVLATPPLRPWYRTKKGLSFADLLRAARIALQAQPIRDPRPDSKNLRDRVDAPVPRQQSLRLTG